MVQVTLQRQPEQNRTLLHFVNLSGAAQVAFHPAIPMGPIHVDVQGSFQSAIMASTGRALSLRHTDGYTTFSLPQLGAYDVVVLS